MFVHSWGRKTCSTKHNMCLKQLMQIIIFFFKYGMLKEYVLCIFPKSQTTKENNRNNLIGNSWENFTNL